MATQFAFVTCGPGGKQSESEKRQVRSHCMKGRNKRVESRRSLQEARRAAAAAAEGKEQQAREVEPVLENGLETPDSSAFASWSTSGSNTPPPLGAVRQDSDAISFVLPYTPPTLPFDPAIARFASAVHKPTREVVQQVASFNHLLAVSYPVETYVDFGTDVKTLTEWLTADKTYFYTILLANSAFGDLLLGRRLTNKTRWHLGMVLTLLNDKLSDRKEHTLDSTFIVILSLAAIASSLGDHDAVEAHLAALKQIVGSRGGLKELRTVPALQFKLEQLDLMWCLNVGGKPKFNAGPVSWCLPAAPTCASGELVSLADSSPPLDSRFLAVFQQLQQLALSINIQYGKYSRMSGFTFQPAISSIQRRLLLLKDILHDTPEESLILGMLAFLSTMFRAPGKADTRNYLARRLRSTYQNMPASTPELHTVRRWLLMMGAITVFDLEDPWVRASWDAVTPSDLSWKEVQHDLRRIMWIQCSHDETGQRAYATLTRPKQ